MKLTKGIIIGFILVLLLLVTIFNVTADEPSEEYDYIQEVCGGRRFIFVMLSLAGDLSAYNQVGAEEDGNIHDEYKISGLYPSDGSAEPIWTIDWYAFRIEISCDGTYLVRYGPWARTGDYEELALGFYENGKLLREYRVSELVAEPHLLPETVSHYSWNKSGRLDVSTNKFHVTTENQEEYTFDITTGEIIEFSPAPTPEIDTLDESSTQEFAQKIEDDNEASSLVTDKINLIILGASIFCLVVVVLVAFYKLKVKGF